MANLVDRYVHQVGKYLPKQDRAEVEAELRSLIADKLDDRFAGEPSDDEIAAILNEMGNPREMAASYQSEKYLIGPQVYPYLAQTLRYGWVIVPLLVVVLNLFDALVISQQALSIEMALNIVWAVVQTTLIFTGAVVLIFVVFERARIQGEFEESAFDPLTLPEVDDPRAVDRYEAVFGVTFGAIFILVMLYFLQVGGLTLRFNMSDPGEVIPVPEAWLITLIGVVALISIIQMIVLRRGTWTVALLVLEVAAEIVGAACLYFVLYTPIAERLIANNVLDGSLNDLITAAPELLTVGYLLIMLINKGAQMVRIANFDSAKTTLNSKRGAT